MRAPRTNIPWTKSDHHDCPDRRSPHKSLRIRADGYGKCFRCGWKGWLHDVRPPTDAEVREADRRQRYHTRLIDRLIAESKPIDDTPVARYLAKRYLTQPWPADLRYHPALLHKPSDQKLPAMIAIVRDNSLSSIVAIHRTYLTHAGDKAPVEPVRMILGPVAACGVHMEPLSADGSKSTPRTVVCICEGIEDGLALRLKFRGFGAWVCLSAKNMFENEPPSIYSSFLIVPDRDEVGERAGNSLYAYLKRDLDEERRKEVMEFVEQIENRVSEIVGVLVKETDPERKQELIDLIQEQRDMLPIHERKRSYRGPWSGRVYKCIGAKDAAELWKIEQEKKPT